MIYRPEIDGLRAIAVLIVIIFHANIGLLEGGFIGVDVFFVISGYLITSIILNDLDKDRFSILDFYERRARRILPALFVVMALCVPPAWWWMEIGDFRNFGESVLAAALFVSNVLFWTESDYFGGEAEEKPLLHTWSLAVEEQFYIVFPLALLMLWRSRRGSSAPVLLIAIGLASLAATEIGWRRFPEANFYLFPTRAWELIAGALCAFAERRGGRRESDALAALGIFGIAASAALMNARTPFPSLLALPTVAGTALIVLFCGPRVRAALSVRPLVAIGLISYSAYLIHQPLFAFARVISLDPPPVPLMAGLAAASLPLGWLSWRLVEQPFRRRGAVGLLRGRRILVASAVGLGAFAAVGAAIRLDPAGLSANPVTTTLIDSDRVRAETWRAVLRNPALAASLERFPARDGAAAADVRVLIVGDSHSKDMMNTLYGRPELFDGLVFRQASINGACYLEADLFGRAVNTAENCVAAFRAENTAKVAEADWIAFSVHWANSPYLVDHLEATIRAHQAAGGRVAVMGGAPVFADSGKLLRSLARTRPADLADKAAIDAAFAAHRDPTPAAFDARLRAIAAATGAVFLDKAAIVCPEAAPCDAVTGDLRPLRYDGHHWTLQGAELYAGRMAATGWLDRLGEKAEIMRRDDDDQTN